MKIFFIITTAGIIFTIRWKSNKNSAQINKIENIIKNVTQSISQGNFEDRGDDNDHDIELKYKMIIKNINQLIESFICPLIEISTKLEVFGDGKIPEKITQNWPGKFNDVKNNFNILNNLLTSLILDIKTMSERSSRGDLKIRLQKENYLGEFQKIVMGMNNYHSSRRGHEGYKRVITTKFYKSN